MADIKTKVARTIEKYEAKLAGIEFRDSEDFNPSDASGGNFDDAYYMGTEHGEIDGALEILYAIDAIIKEDE